MQLCYNEDMKTFSIVTPTTEILLEARRCLDVTNMQALADAINPYMPYNPATATALTKWSEEVLRPEPCRLLQLVVFAPRDHPAYQMGRDLLTLYGYALPPDR